MQQNSPVVSQINGIRTYSVIKDELIQQVGGSVRCTAATADVDCEVDVQVIARAERRHRKRDCLLTCGQPHNAPRSLQHTAHARTREMLALAP